MGKKHEKLCERELIPAYVDGELDNRTLMLLESHLEGCDSCRDELRAHRMFVCELDSVMAGDSEIAVPADFSRVVASRASSDMSGVRSAAENRKALAFCVVLALAGVSLLGGDATREIALNVGRKVVGTIVGLVGFVWNAVYDLMASITVISRVLSRKFVIETGGLGVVLVLLALAVILLSRLISSYHRTGATE